MATTARSKTHGGTTGAIRPANDLKVPLAVKSNQIAPKHRIPYAIQVPFFNAAPLSNQK
jgi:hypothetical protein